MMRGKTVAGAAAITIAIACVSSFMPQPAMAQDRTQATPPTPPQANQPTPSYAKWGKLAVAETKKRYPDMDIVDYLHMGRDDMSKSVSRESFKLWLRSDSREFGVIVGIYFDKCTDKLERMTFQEVRR